MNTITSSYGYDEGLMSNKELVDKLRKDLREKPSQISEQKHRDSKTKETDIQEQKPAEI